MAQASRNVRKIRRIKLERSRAYKALDIAISQRDQARMIAGALEVELKKYTDDPFPEDAPEVVPSTPSLTIRRFEDEETPNDTN